MIDEVSTWSIKSVLIGVSDVVRSAAFYESVMNLQVVRQENRMAVLGSDKAGQYALYLRETPHGLHPGQQIVGVRSLVWDVGPLAELLRVEGDLRARNSFRGRRAISEAQPFELLQGYDPDRLPLAFVAYEEGREMSLNEYCHVMEMMYSLDL
jgi:catechol 2,3-dioxygenase-like lactoylglutathione lyase family enzyme